MVLFVHIKRNSYVDDLFRSNLPSESFAFNDRFGCYVVDSKYTYGVAELLSATYPRVAKKILTSMSHQINREYADKYKDLFVNKSLPAQTYPAPKGLSYFTFQNEAIAYAMERQYTLLGDEMGLGKTVEAVGVANAMGASSILVVCKKIGISTWVQHFNQWLVKDLPVRVNATKSSREVVIVNYASMHKMMPLLLNKSWDYLIVDEAHFVSNFSCNNGNVKGTKRAKNVFMLADRVGKAVFLSGTFYKNSAEDLWPFLNTFDPENWKDKTVFKEKYCQNRDSYTPEAWKLRGGNNLVELQQKLKNSILLRREKTEVAKELPPKLRQIVLLDSNGEVKKLLDRQEDMLGQLKCVDVENVSNIPFDKLASFRKALGITKADLVCEYLADLLNKTDKIVVFAHHTAVIDKIHQMFKGAAVKYYGDTSEKKAKYAVNRFKNDPSIKLFIGNMNSAGTTITLTNSHTVVFAEMSWVPDEHLQAEDRCHRIGQQYPVNIIYLLLDDPLDKRLLNVVTSKEEEFRMTMGTKVLEKAKRMVLGRREGGS